MTFRLTVHKGVFAVCQLPADAGIPSWATGGLIWQVLRTPRGLTVICETERVPTGQARENHWHALEVAGPLSFDLAGVLHALLTPLAKRGVPVLAVSGYSTDYILVRDLASATKALREARHEVY